jgi:hypothetical protein
MPCAFGWSTHNAYQKGHPFSRLSGLPIRPGNILKLVLDCGNHKIFHYIMDKDAKSLVYDSPTVEPATVESRQLSLDS